MFLFRSISDEPRVEISGLVVDVGLRSQGVGDRLLARAEEWANEKRLCEIEHRYHVIERAHMFYERHGYQHTKTQKSFRKLLDE